LRNANEPKYNVFLCYYSAGGWSFAEHLWKKLPHLRIEAYLDKKDNPVTMRGSDEWRNHIDNAIRNCQYFVLIMTIGFKDRREIKREIKLALDNNIDIIFMKHNRLEPSDLIVNLGDSTLDIYDKKQVFTFKNESNIFNTVSSIITKGKENIKPIPQYDLKKKLFEKFFEPIYSDIEIILENYEKAGYNNNHNTSEYDRVGKPLRYKLKRYENDELKNNIDKFYNISNTRQKHLSLYPHKTNVIVNKVIETKNDNERIGWEIDKKRDIYMDIEIEVLYRDEKKEMIFTNFSYDLLYKQIGANSKRHQGIESNNFIKALVYVNDGPAIIIQGYLFDEIWRDILSESEKDETFKYLRNSLDELNKLGLNILSEIDKEFSELHD